MSYVYLEHSNSGTGDIGDTNFGGVSALGGDNSTVSVTMWAAASDGNAGVMTVGDFDISVSATTTVDLSGLSNIYVEIDHHAWGSHELLGALDIGDISLAAGDDASISLSISQSGSADPRRRPQHRRRQHHRRRSVYSVRVFLVL